MRVVLEVIVWGSLGGLLYTYIGYPFLLAIFGLRHKRANARQPLAPTVTVIIAAWNEGPRLSARIENCLRQQYSPGRLDVIVVSDGSTDETEQVVLTFAHEQVRLIKLETRQGKAVALNAGVAASNSDIIVFADARQQFAPSAVAELVANFADPQAGAVSGELMLGAETDQLGAEGSGLYWKIEKWIRRKESEFDSVVGVTGAIYAIRRSLFSPLPKGAILDDLLVPMRIALGGHRILFEPRALAFDKIEGDYAQVLHRKIRTLAGNYQTIKLCPDLINPWRNRLFVQFVSHKVCRLAAPFWLLLLFISSGLLLNGIFRYLFLLQVLGYAMALGGWSLYRVGVRERFTMAAFTFCLLNYAAFIAAMRYYNGAAVWDKPVSTKSSASSPIVGVR
jgi:cellulose synthase/poly-beta-1,6-N-acetylglucosamine synthase-like glycosyltransferase